MNILLVYLSFNTSLCRDCLQCFEKQCNWNFSCRLTKGQILIFQKDKTQIDNVHSSTWLTNFHSMDLTRDNLSSLVCKWQTLIKAHMDVKTTDGYALQILAIGFTKKTQPI